MKAKSIKGTSPGEITIALKQAMTDGFKPTVAFVFLSVDQDRQAINDQLGHNQVSIFGVTTVGEFTEGGVASGSIAILLLELDRESFRIVIKDHSDDDVVESGRYIGEIGKRLFSQPAFIISGSDIETAGEHIMQGILERVENEPTVVGGMAGEFVFSNQQESKRGVLALILDESKISLTGETVSGWKAVGTEKTITDCEGAWLKTIDHHPALDVVRKFTGLDLDDPGQNDSWSDEGRSFPIQIQQKKGEPVMRPLLNYRPSDGSIFCGGNLVKGSTFRFSLPPDLEVAEKVIQSARDKKETEMPDAEAVLIFSCIGRKSSLGPMAEQEVLGIQEVWSKPMAGFFSLGEFGKTKNGITQFHGTSISWVALKEK